MTRSVLAVVLVGAAAAWAACGGSSDAPDAAHGDAAHGDAPRGDAAVDAVDAGPSLSPACTTAPAMLLDASPRVIGNLALAGDTLYASAWLEDASGHASDAVVLAVDAHTGAQVAAPFAVASPAALSAANGDVYAAVAAGAVWQFHPGVAPVAVVAGRASARVATADAAYVYWSEDNAVGESDGPVYRTPLAGGAVEQVMRCDSPARILVSGNQLYCPDLSGNLWHGPVDGSANTTIPYGGYAISAAIVDGGQLYFTNIYTNPQLWRVPLPSGPATRIVQVAEPGRFVGLAASSDYFYTVDSVVGLRRIHRGSAAVEILYQTVGLGADPVLYDNTLLFAAPDPAQSGLRYIMRCTD